jgi:hypothetical protein
LKEVFFPPDDSLGSKLLLTDTGYGALSILISKQTGLSYMLMFAPAKEVTGMEAIDYLKKKYNYKNPVSIQVKRKGKAETVSVSHMAMGPLTMFLIVLWEDNKFKFN